MNPECNLPEEEQKAVLSRANLFPSDEEEETVRELFPQYLFYYSVGDRQVFCTACRQRFEVSPKKRGKHGSDVACPRCRSKATWATIGKFSYGMSTLKSWIKTAIARPAGDGGLYIIAGEASRAFNWNNLAGEIDWCPWKVYYFRPGAVMMCSIRQVYNCWDLAQRETFVVFEERVKEPFAPNMQGYCDYAGDYNIIGLDKALEASDFKYCQILPFYEYEFAARLDELDTARWMMKYLAWYALHPQIEMAVKFGLSEAVWQLVVEGKLNKRLLNWDGTTPAEFLRMSKQEVKHFIGSGMGFDELKIWKTYGAKLSIERYLKLSEEIGRRNIPELAGCAKIAGVSIEKAARYIQSMKPMCARNAPTTESIIHIWKDYLDMAGRLDYDLNEPTVVMPKNLKERHDAAAAVIRHNTSKMEREKYKKRRKKLEKQYEFSLGELCIIVPKSSEEIVQEGKTLKHCVGGYAARHIEGSTTILFLRKRRTPGRSFLTIELKKERGRIGIRQIHGYRNEHYSNDYSKIGAAPIERYADFLQTWLDWVNDGSKRDKDGRPTLPEQEAKTA